MKILFTYPGVANIGFNSFFNRKDSVDSWYIPVGLCYLAAVAKREGHDVDLMDLRYLSGYEEVEEKIISSGCDVVALSYQTPGAEYAMEVAKIAKKHNKITVAGGIHPTIMPDEVLSSGLIDHVIVGEGAISFPELVNNLEKGAIIEPLITGKYVDNLDEIPFPHYFDLYVDTIIKEHKLAMIFTSRGCPGRCEFCQPVANKLFGKKVKFRSADNIINELLDWQKRYGITHFMVLDDTFLVKKNLVKDFCRKLMDFKVPLTWQCNARVNEFEEEMIRLMAESRCNWICIGFESGSQRILDLTKKGTTVEQGYKAAELCYKYNIGFTTNIIAGVPGETEEDYKKNLEFVKTIKATTISYNWLVPYPGTDTFYYCQKNNLLNKDIRWDGYEMNRIKERGIISTVDYGVVRDWEKKIVFWKGEIPKKNLIIEKARKFEIKGEFAKALDQYFILIEEYPANFDGYYYCAKVYKKKGELDLAVQYFQKAMPIIQKSKNKDFLISTHFHMGEIYFNIGEKNLAKREFEICKELTPIHKEAEKYLIALNSIA
ncbi:MAG: radical SAM protein [Nitrospinae bacterium]|nr:radical SAM protein [Nitrospinota bacterium]